MRQTTSVSDVHICLLGGFFVSVDGQPVEDHWRLRKAKTLVKLLTLAPGHRMHRDVVLERLWPDAEPEAAMNNLHQLMHNVRRMMGPTAIALSDDVIRLCPAGGLTVDVDLFEKAAAEARSSGDLAVLNDALHLWTGPLLPEDDYAGERLTETHAAVATLLAFKLVEQDNPEAALAILEPLASARPLDEKLHRVFIDALASLGRRWEAIEAYERLRDGLEEAYAAEPEPETKTLYRRLLSGDRLVLGAQPATALKRAHNDTESLIGREAEWERLSSSWQRASAGESHLFLITGEAGIGKTRLAEELLAWADEQRVAYARTRSYGAEGRLALAPVIDWLRSDVIGQSLGRLSELWLTEITRLLPELLAERPRLPRPQPMSEFGQRQHFFEGLARAVLAVPQPLLLLIDDLQWCDQETLHWLHFLLRFDPKKRLLIIGTARTDEVVSTHPVADWLGHLRSEGSVIELALDPLDAVQTAQLAVQVSRDELDDRSALHLYRETEGNPLFVVEMASAGLTKQLPAIGSVEPESLAPHFSTANLPPRMHAVIASRLAKLSPAAHELAGAASTIGRVFSVEVLRKASELDSVTAMEAVDELWQRRIVRAASTSDTFDFSHDKIRDVAYAELSPVKQRYWHSRIAEALEEIYAANLDPVSAQLATHYEQAGEPALAIPFYQRAAEVAERVYAHDEAISLLKRGLMWLHNVPESPHRNAQHLDLLRLLSLALVATRGYGAPEVVETLSQAQTLNETLEKPPDPLLLRALAITALSAGDFQQGLRFGDQLLQLADQQGDPILLVEGHYVLGVTLQFVGSFTRSRIHLEQALTHYDPSHSSAHITQYSQDPGVICRCRLAFGLWCLGYPDQARVVETSGLAEAQALAHPFSLAYALIWKAMLQGEMGNIDSQFEAAEAAIVLSDAHHLRFWSAWGRVLRGWALAEARDQELGLAELRQGGEQMRSIGGLFLQPFVSLLLAEQLLKIGQVEDGLEFVNEALASTAHDRYWCDAELERLRGDLLIARGVHAQQVEAAYRRAIQIAHKQQARIFELRARTSLAQLLIKQGRSAEAHQLLTVTYDWFTAGFHTRDIENARAVLQALREAPSR
jgi:DNA-binding SARP family transcriptional activator/predicted negative regulator of RcsB-dependent stress response